MLPEYPDSATAGLDRLARKGGVRQVNIQIANVKPDLADPSWEPFWNALERAGSSWLARHRRHRQTRSRATGKPASVFEATKLFMGQFLEPFVDLFAWGILERHPRIKLVLSEAGTGWLPWLVEELDYRHWRLWEAKEYWADKGGIALQAKPSELFRRQNLRDLPGGSRRDGAVAVFRRRQCAVGFGLPASRQRVAEFPRGDRAADVASDARDAAETDSRQRGDVVAFPDPNGSSAAGTHQNVVIGRWFAPPRVSQIACDPRSATQQPLGATRPSTVIVIGDWAVPHEIDDQNVIEILRQRDRAALAAGSNPPLRDEPAAPT